MLREVEINDKSYPVRFDVNSLCEFEEITGRSLLTKSVSVDLRFVRALVYVGLKGGHSYQEGKRFEQTLESIGLLIGEHVKKHGSIEGVLSKFLPVLQECLGVKSEDSKQAGDEPGESTGGR